MLVVGAGASKEAGLPLGAELTKEIKGALAIRESDFEGKWTGDPKILAALEQLANERGMHALMTAAADIREGMQLASSIDSFIDMHRGNELVATVGKLAIASRILSAEGTSKLRVDRSNIYNTIRFEELHSTWFNALQRLLTDRCHKSELAARLRTVTIVSFNYDRCIEHYLHGALRHIYRESAEWANDVLKSLDIYHPYGKVGGLPWMGEQTAIDFGDKPHSTTLIELSRQLLTFSESKNADTSCIECIRNDIANAERIAFLGFAFHSMNLDLLFDGRGSIDLNDGATRTMYGTARGISEANIANLSEAIPRRTNRMRDVCAIRDLTCEKLFHEFGLGLALR